MAGSAQTLSISPFSGKVMMEGRDIERMMSFDSNPSAISERARPEDSEKSFRMRTCRAHRALPEAEGVEVVSTRP